MNQSNEKPMVVFVDGAAEPTNPGPMGAAYVLQDAAGSQVEARGYFLGHGTNNVAEYQGAIKGIEAAIRHGATSLEVRSDSQLVVKQVLNLWGVNNEALRVLRDQVLQLLNRVGRWEAVWIPREKNTKADTCATNAIKFHQDVVYDDREILASESAARVRTAVGDYLRTAGKRTYRKPAPATGLFDSQNER